MFRLRLVSANLLVLSLLAGCSVRQVAVHWLGDALAGGGGVYASDNDPDLIREALPFGLKTFESLLESAPEHRGLLQATAQGFTAYAYFLQLEAERLDAGGFPASAVTALESSQALPPRARLRAQGPGNPSPRSDGATQEQRLRCIDNDKRGGHSLPLLGWRLLGRCHRIGQGRPGIAHRPARGRRACQTSS